MMIFLLSVSLDSAAGTAGVQKLNLCQGQKGALDQEV